MEDLLDDYSELSEKVYPLAENGARFVNYIIDLVLLMVILFSIGIVMIFMSNDPEAAITQERPFILEYLLNSIVMIFYYTFFEFVFKGKTLGKLLTRTRAVNAIDGRLSFSDAFMRSLCRVIPFEAFSFLGEKGKGWHDSISKTRVIVDKDWSQFN